MTRTTHPLLGTLPRLFAAAMTLGAIALFSSGAGAQLSYECITFSPSNPSPSLFTWDDYDRWVLEAGGETFVFDGVGANTLITSGNGADIDVVHKCTEVTEPEAPTPTVGPVTPEPIPTPEATATPGTTTTPEATPEATTSPETTPEATATARATATPAPTLEPTPEPTATETPEATPVPTATETTQPIPTPTATATPEVTPTVEVEILVPEPPSPDDPDATDDPEPSATPEVLGSQLANTGVSTATANATKIGAALLLGGGALMAAGARRRSTALD